MDSKAHGFLSAGGWWMVDVQFLCGQQRIALTLAEQTKFKKLLPA